MSTENTPEVTQELQDEAPATVICSLTGKEAAADQSFSLKNYKDEEVIISLEASFTLATTPAILNAIALNRDAYEAVQKFRHQAEAKNQGVQEGAQQVVEMLKAKAEEMGLTDSLEDLVNAVFAKPEAE